MAEILVFSEQAEVAYELVSQGREFSRALGLGLAAALLGAQVRGRADAYFAYGAERVYLGEDAALADFYADTYAAALAQIARDKGARLLLIGSTRRGKELAGRVAQKLGAGCITDAIGLRVQDGALLVERYALGGNTVATETIQSAIQVVSVMPKTFELGPREARAGQVVEVALALKPSRARIVEKKAKVGEAVNVEAAAVLVVAGRGIAKKEDLAIVEDLARALGGEVGCTRSLSADLHWLAEERMVGISGKKCKPGLHISVGVSGQIQHTVGILGSKLIVAINKDKGAPIFKIADYGIVGDLYQVVPKLTQKIKELR